MADPTLIGIDVGTTSLKAILIDTKGNRLASFSKPYSISRPKPGYAEQDPDDWMQGLLGALDHFAHNHDLTGLKGIGICSQVNTHVFVGADGEALMPAIVWQDGRCAEDADRLDAQISSQQKNAWFGGPMPIDASHALSRMAHVARCHPDIYANTRHVLLPKDYCIMKVTGAIGSDPISAVGLVDTKLNYADELIALVPGAQDRLPRLLDFSHRIGVVRGGLPCAGVPVVTGTMDAWSGMFGSGVVTNGDGMLQCGTSEIPGIISPKLVPTPGVIVFAPYAGIRLHAAPTQSGGAALAWLSTIMDKPPEDLSALAEAVAPSQSVPLFLPHLQGERAPIWDADTRGVFARLDSGTGPGEMVRGVMEGVAFSVRLAFDALEKSADQVMDTINIGGGGSRSDVWCQIRADALGKTLRRTAVPDVGAIGAAILAGTGIGVLPPLPSAVHQMVQFDQTFSPNPELRRYYDDKFENYNALYDTLKPFNARY